VNGVYNQTVKASVQADVDGKGINLKVVAQSGWYV
jgi:hypothetical protein